MSVKIQKELWKQKETKTGEYFERKVGEPSYLKPYDVRKNTKRDRQLKRGQNRRVSRKEKLERQRAKNR